MAPTRLNTSDDIDLIFGLLSAILAVLAILLAWATWKLQKRDKHGPILKVQQFVFYANFVLTPGTKEEARWDEVHQYPKDFDEDLENCNAPPRYEKAGAKQEEIRGDL
jgi:hypothetical protein